MANLSSLAVVSPIGGIDNPYLSAAMAGFSLDWWPPYFDEVLATAQSSLTRHLPVQSSPRPISAQQATAYSDDFYHRIHVRPGRLDLGNVVSTQSVDVYVWNAYLVPKTLETIDGTDEGLQLAGQSAPPLIFQGLQELAWELSVTPDGQPVLDTVIEWQFAGGATGELRVTANRIIAWSFAPDWADGVLETLEWLTDILSSESLVEQRRALRVVPRRQLQAPMLFEGRERQLLDMALFGWGSRIWALPIWPDIQLLAAPVALGAVRVDCQTEFLDFQAGGMAMLRGEDAFTYEVVEILNIDAGGLDLKRGTQQAWPARTRLYPARTAQLVEAPQLSRLTDQLQSADVRFLILEVCDWPEVLPATLYRGRPVLEQAPDESEDLTSSYARLLSTLDSGQAVPLVTDMAQHVLPVQGWRWLDLGRAERAALRSLLYGLRGQQVPVWVPTHADDLTIKAAVSAVATTLDIEHIGYTRFGQGKPGRRDIRIQLWNGSVFYRRITSSVELDSSTERLLISSSLGVLVEPAQIARVSWMVISRLNSDQVEIDHQTDSEGVASCALTFRGVRDDEF